MHCQWGAQADILILERHRQLFQLAQHSLHCSAFLLAATLDEGAQAFLGASSHGDHSLAFAT
ncbi:hypothetical protein D3C78_1566160 [compost metagenome]